MIMRKTWSFKSFTMLVFDKREVSESMYIEITRFDNFISRDANISLKQNEERNEL